MATADRASISGDALDILDCFVSGLDDVILEVAETVARGEGAQGQPVQVEVQHVEKAADIVIDALLNSAKLMTRRRRLCGRCITAAS